MKSGVQIQTSNKTGAQPKNVIKVTLKTVAIRESQTLISSVFPLELLCWSETFDCYLVLQL